MNANLWIALLMALTMGLTFATGRPMAAWEQALGWFFMGANFGIGIHRLGLGQ